MIRKPISRDPDFDLTLHSDTKMPYYWGGNSGNVGTTWMHPQLMNIPS